VRKKDYVKEVSILVFLDQALKDNHVFNNNLSYGVSILVFLDQALKEEHCITWP